MSWYSLLGQTLSIALVFSAIAATPAFAVTFLLAEWLVGGTAITTELLVEVSGEILLEDTKVPILGKAMILCSGTGVGLVQPNSLGEGSEILTLSRTAISNSPLSGEALTCVDQENCEEPLLWPIGLPAEGEVELMEDSGTFFAVLGFAPSDLEGGWEVECMKSVIGAITDECRALQGATELALEGTTLLLKNTEAFNELSGEKLGNCSQGGAESGILEGEGALTLSEGGELTASSESSVA